MNNETLLIVSIGLCLGMVVLATYTGFSTALGAFIMGSILAETIEAEHIEHIIQPVKDLFGAIFFVSVGMLVNPAVLVEYAWPVIIITLVTIIGKAIFSSFGVLLSGEPLNTLSNPDSAWHKSESLLSSLPDWVFRSKCSTRSFHQSLWLYLLSPLSRLLILSVWPILLPNGFTKYCLLKYRNIRSLCFRQEDHEPR